MISFHKGLSKVFACALVGFLAPLAHPAAISQAKQGVADTDIVIGQSCQLSGPLAALSSQVRLGAGLYFDHVNAAGGIEGRKIRVVALDDAFDPYKAADNTRELIDTGKGAGPVPVPPALRPRWRRCRPSRKPVCLFIAPFTGSDALRLKFSRYVFNIKAGYGSELDAMVKQLGTIGINRIAVVYLNNPFGTGGLASVEKSAKAYGVSLAARAPLEVDGSKMDSAVAAVAKVEPPAIIVISAGKPSVDFVDAYLKGGHRSTFYMLSVISNLQLVKALGERARGIVVSQVVPSPWNKSLSVSREFQAPLAKAKRHHRLHLQPDGRLPLGKISCGGLETRGPQADPRKRASGPGSDEQAWTFGGFEARAVANPAQLGDVCRSVDHRAGRKVYPVAKLPPLCGEEDI